MTQYITPIILVLVLEMVFLIVLPAARSIIYSAVSLVGRSSLASYKGELAKNNFVTFVWNNVMASVGCCGVHNYTDFTHNRAWQVTKLDRQASGVVLNSLQRYAQTQDSAVLTRIFLSYHVIKPDYSSTF